MKTSQQGIDLIKRFEGFSPKRYVCLAGKDTIGYGHAMQPDEDYYVITGTQAEELLRNDIAKAEYTIDTKVKVPLTQSQFDALVSLIFNWGSTNFLQSEGLQKLNKGDYEGAIEEFKEVNKVSNREVAGLINRRTAEERLWNASTTTA